MQDKQNKRIISTTTTTSAFKNSKLIHFVKFIDSQLHISQMLRHKHHTFLQFNKNITNIYNYCIKNTKQKKDKKKIQIHTPPIVFVKDVQVKVVKKTKRKQKENLYQLNVHFSLDITYRTKQQNGYLLLFTLYLCLYNLCNVLCKTSDSSWLAET